jgi:hypothetical protein
VHECGLFKSRNRKLQIYMDGLRVLSGSCAAIKGERRSVRSQAPPRVIDEMTARSSHLLYRFS